MRYYLQILATVLLVSSTPSLKADFLPLELGNLFNESDHISIGTIETVNDATFEFRSSKVFKGTPALTVITVKRYSDWPDGRRWADYATGQNVFLFLETSADTPEDVWKIRGLGGEGEMPVFDGKVYPHGVNLKGFERQVHKIGGGRINGYRFDIDTFEVAMTGYLRCFGSEQDQSSACTKEELALYCEGSTLNEFLANSANKKDDN